MFVSEYFGLGDEFDKKEIFDCILDKDSPFFINLMRLKVCDIPEFQGSYQSINDHFSKIATLLNAFDSEGDKTSRFFNRDRYHLYAHIHAVYRQTEEL